MSPIASRLELQRPSPGVAFIVYAAVGLFLGLLGPFGSYLNDGGLLTRLVYWIVTSLISCTTFDLILRATAPRTTGVPKWLVTPLMVILATVPLSFATHALALLIWPRLPNISWIQWYVQALLVSVIYIVARPILTRSQPLARQQSGSFRLGSGVLCLQMEDHYVRVHTADGSRLVLSSLGRAVGQLKGVEGLQVHRSWWVARNAVECLVEDGRNIRLRLSNGLEAPVARNRIAALRAAGWLGR